MHGHTRRLRTGKRTKVASNLLHVSSGNVQRVDMPEATRQHTCIVVNCINIGGMAYLDRRCVAKLY